MYIYIEDAHGAITAWSFLKAFGWLLRALERLLGGSREALGRFLEASKKHLGPKTVIGSIFGRFLKKTEILGVPLGDGLT